MMDWIEIEGIGRSAPNLFSPGELEAATGLTTDMQRVWRRRGHLRARAADEGDFTAFEVAVVAIRHELARFGVAPKDSLFASSLAAPIVLYHALLSCDGAAELKGGFQAIAAVAERFAEDDRLAATISGCESICRYLWSAAPPAFRLTPDFAMVLHEEQNAGLLVLDLQVVGINLVERAPKPLFLIELNETRTTTTTTTTTTGGTGGPPDPNILYPED